MENINPLFNQIFKSFTLPAIRVKTYNCINCEIIMKVDINPYNIDENGINTAKKSFYGGFVCSDNCEKEFDLKMRKDVKL